jgi:hypothetical protein
MTTPRLKRAAIPHTQLRIARTAAAVLSVAALIGLGGSSHTQSSGHDADNGGPATVRTEHVSPATRVISRLFENLRNQYSAEAAQPPAGIPPYLIANP